MARQRCLRRSRLRPERSSRRIQNAGAVSSSSTSWTASPRLFRTASFTSSSTISTPTKRMSIGSRPIPMCNFISRRQARPGSIRSRYGSRSCRGSRLAAPPSQALSSSSSTSMPTSKHITTKLNPSSGPRKRSVNADSKAAVSLSSDSGYLVYMFFLITPPEMTVERAWKRGLQVGRYKAVEDLLAHNVEAYTGMPELFFTWALDARRRVHYEFLDNSVPAGDRPLTVAFGWNGEMTILDVKRMLDVDRFRKIDIH